MWTEHAEYSNLPVKEAQDKLSAASDFSALKRKLQTTTADTNVLQVSTAASKIYMISETHLNVSKQAEATRRIWNLLTEDAETPHENWQLPRLIYEKMIDKMAFRRFDRH